MSRVDLPPIYATLPPPSAALPRARRARVLDEPLGAT
jgi:hypothetical protein